MFAGFYPVMSRRELSTLFAVLLLTPVHIHIHAFSERISMRRLALPRQQPIIGGTLIGDSGLKRQSKDLSRWLVLLPLCSFVAGCLLANSRKSLFQLDQEMIRRTASTDTIVYHRVLQDSSENNVTDDVILDMLSMGSKTRPDYYRTQHLIYTTHPAVRNFMVMTEANDTESTCATDLTKEHIDQICAHCRNKDRFWGIPKGEYSLFLQCAQI